MSLLLVAVILAVCFGLGAWLGAPYLPVLRRDVEALMVLADVRPGSRVLDLGSGDGRLLVAASRRGARAVGYEINPLLYAWSKLSAWRYHQHIEVRLGDYWRADWPEVDVVFVFLIGRYMPKLDQELFGRLTKPTKVVSYGFAIPGRVPVKTTKNSFLYHYPTVK